MTEWLHPLAAATALLPTDQAFRFHYVQRHGSMKVGLYSPREADTQGPHKQDELYVVVAGSGWFVRDGERRAFGANDVIFVTAGTPHRFVDFTEDFATWVIFWGPDGGEDAQAA